MQYYKYTFIFIESELLCLLLRWPYGQSTIGSQCDKTTYISQSTKISWLGLSGRGGGWWWVKGVEKAWNFFHKADKTISLWIGYVWGQMVNFRKKIIFAIRIWFRVTPPNLVKDHTFTFFLDPSLRPKYQNINFVLSFKPRPENLDSATCNPYILLYCFESYFGLLALFLLFYV